MNPEGTASRIRIEWLRQIARSLVVTSVVAQAFPSIRDPGSSQEGTSGAMLSRVRPRLTAIAAIQNKSGHSKKSVVGRKLLGNCSATARQLLLRCSRRLFPTPFYLPHSWGRTSCIHAVVLRFLHLPSIAFEANAPVGPEGVSARKARIIEPRFITVRFPWCVELHAA